jgi:polyketide synthase PksM
MKKSEKNNILDIPNGSFFELCQEQFSEKKLFIFETEKTAPVFLTGEMLSQKAMILGNILQNKIAQQEKALILLPQGLEYIYTMLACFYANVIAVPVPVSDVSNSEQVIDKLNALLKDSHAKCIITDAYCQDYLKKNAGFDSIFMINALDLIQAEPGIYQSRAQLPEDIAILLYTSGSTSLPKGVMISHYNLKVRALVSAIQWQIDKESCIVSWLPQYHSFAQDLNIFSPMLKGATSILQAPANFIKNPENWLLAIDRYQATHTGAPNFAFDYCCTSIDHTALKGISLKSLQLILSGGEPIRRESCDSFYNKFRDLGLDKNVFCPIYGLSEMGTVVTKTPGQPMQILSLDMSGLEKRKVKISDLKDKGKSVTSCGEIVATSEIKIVNPEICTPCSANEVGEIWIKSPAVGRGYFNRKQETKDTFCGILSDTKEGRFLRTGDLGFIHENHLYIVGREKEVIIIYGKNYYPVDIEWTIKNKLTYLDLPIAVFSCEIDQHERVIVVQEFESSQNESEYQNVASEILSIVSLAYQIETYDIVLVSKNSIPKTASGKIQRKACGNAYINNQLNIRYQYCHQNIGMQAKSQNEPSTVNRGILETLKEVLIEVLQISAERFEVAKSFNELGLNSIQYIQIAKRIEEIFEIEFNPVMLFEYKDFTALAQYLATQTEDSQYQTTDQSYIEKGFITEPLNNNENEIAIIGISCHFPGGATDQHTFWNNLIQQKDCITPISDRECIIADYQKSRADSEDSLPQWGGFIKDVDAFDAPFFNISPLEAESMDPQQRKVLELTWSVIEDGGYNPLQLSDSNVGLFIGVHTNDYAELVSRQSALMETYGAFLDSGLHMSMIANRVSRWLDFHGPSEVINTACSSSLVAVHHAVEAISNGECNLAVAGGINLLLASRGYCAANRGGMLSTDGRCKSFDQVADGFVRAEGYGAVLLKSLSQAKADGDNIYGVIKSTAINHDGRSNSLRAPNLTAQKQLIKTAFKKSKIPTWSLSYIETHGTGTALGDPIEIQALKEAFLEMGENKTGAHCALGSVKTNIGHCESAAGIAGLIKILLSIKHRIIPGILHFKQINPYISLDNSPFFIADKHHNWKRIQDADGTELPLRAGISSFGFGGSNAHVIIEEYIPDKNDGLLIRIDTKNPAIVVLSAKNDERLLEQAKQLLVLLSRQQNTDTDMANIAYTLQTGREAMEERLGIIAGSIKELGEKLQGFIEGKEDIKELYRGQVMRHKDALAVFSMDEDMANAIDAWVDKKKYGKLLDLWVKGLVFDWKKLYGEVNPHRISLPTYPFALERYWIADANVQEKYRDYNMAQLHPLVHTNTSNFAAQCFSSVFSGEEFFLKDHVIKIDGLSGQKVLPGVAYLEMARAAIEQAMPTQTESTTIELHNTVWIQPIIVNGNRQVIITLFPNGTDGCPNEEVEYEIYSQDKVQRIIHCQGQAVINRKAAPAQLNIKELKGQMRQGPLEANHLYLSFIKMGLNYGPSLQGIRTVYQGEKQLLAQLRLPVAVEASQNDYLLHPSLMDSALQTSICLIEDLAQLSNKPPMPFGLEFIHIISACTKEMFAWVRYSQGRKPEDTVSKFDIDLCDLQGNVCVQMRGFSTRVPEEHRFSHKTTPLLANHREIMDGLQYLVPVWNPVSLETYKKIIFPESTKILLLGGNQTQLDWVQKSFPNVSLLQLPSAATIDNIQAKLNKCSFDHLLWIAPDVVQTDGQTKEDDKKIIDKQEEGVLTVFRIIKALLKLEYANKELQWTIITGKTQRVKKDDRTKPTHAGICGLIGSLAKEYLHWNLRLLDIDSLESVTANECLSLPWDKDGNSLVYRQGEWFCQELAHLAVLPQVTPVYKQKGVYVVIGGAGGVGEMWSRFMIEHYQAKMVWIGRQECNDAIKDKIKLLSQLGHTPLYISADATKFEALEQAFKKILETYPTIHGVVHSAIVLQDQSITLMEESIFRACLSAKVDISVNMNRVFGEQDLDFMLFFSSLISFDKSAGQSNYAAGCTFKDSYAQSLQQKHTYPVKIMNWGYWGMTGIVTDESYKKRMLQKGIGSIEPQEGMTALQTLVGSEISQMVLHKTLNTQAIADLNVTETVSYYPKATTFDFSQVQKTINKQYSSKQATTLETGRLNAAMETLAAEILASSLISLGLFSHGISKISGLSMEKQPAPFYERWLSYSIGYLQQQKWLNSDLTFNKIKGPGELWIEWETQKSEWVANPDLKAQLILLEACLKALPNILSGNQTATDVMFPNSSMQLVEGIYKKNATADYYNEVLAETLKACIKQQLQADKESKFRILEIGAGTGGTTAKLLPLLKEFTGVIIEYCYTDLSKAFLLHAEEHYQPQFPALTTTIFDVSKPLASQLIATDYYDLVIATNVLHATPNIRETLRNAKALMKNQGIILVNEISTWSLFTHLTFGLLEGWWLYEDVALRLPGSPGLTPEKWNEVLSEEGFESIYFPASKRHQFGQQVIAARSNGKVRQRITIQKQANIERSVSIPKITKQIDARKDFAGPIESLREKCIPYFQKLVAETLRMNPGQVKPFEPFSKYGLDSILVVQLTNKLRKVFPDITSTLFFEVQSLDGLINYFLENNKEILMSIMPGIMSVDVPQVSLPSDIIVQEQKSYEDKASSILKRSRQKSFQEVSNADAVSSIFDVAIIGLSGRYPKSNNLNEFWINLSKGINCITEIPKDRWNWEEYYDAEKGKPGKIYTRWGGFLEEIDKFDPLFFKISPKEAKRMDPQERIFLESCYHAIEDAGYTPENLCEIDKIGVFAGVMNARYTPQPFHYSIANRVSYLFNFQGPSMAVDTACSSSLTAIHLALESMYSGLTGCAIVGGVNLIIDPVHYLGLTEMTMLSSGNQCKSFGEMADGFVDSEGVGVIVLKSLKQAEQDGDHIYGVIKGSAVNAGGKTHGYTVPNPKAQSALVSKALGRSKIDVEQISYIEAHGTGTALGDPIEIASLTRVFKETSDKNQFCSIGSVKSNIGHGESAAGIAGLTKVLLQLKHKQLVPSLHSQVANPEIDFSQTPFKVQKSLEKWQRPLHNVNGVVQEIPRIAGISSFGAGGANAHLIVQEYISPTGINQPNVYHEPNTKVFIPLSARTIEQLKQKALDLLGFIGMAGNDLQSEEQAISSNKLIDLTAMAYTLQVGRVAMEERLGFMVSSVDQLTDKLQAYINGERDIEDTYQGQVKGNKDTLSLFSTDADLQQAMDKWVSSKKFSKLFDLWAKGLDLDWNKFYEEVKPSRISLPTYPFARDRYWIDAADTVQPASKSAVIAVLHPLLHLNTSDLMQQSYSSTFSGKEFFWADKGGVGLKILPAVAFLEMARAAVEKAMPAPHESSILELHNVAWGQPFVFTENKQVTIALFSKNNEQVDYEIYSRDNGEEIIHCQGQAIFIRKQAQSKLNIEQLKKQKGQGINQILAEIQLPVSLRNNQNNYILHPSLMDSALQVATGLISDSFQNQLSTPFALESLCIETPFSKEMFVWVGYSQGCNPEDTIIRLDIDLCDLQGNVCAQMRGISYQCDLFSMTLPEPKHIALATKEISFSEHQEKKITQVELNEPSGISVVTPGDLTLEKTEPIAVGKTSVSLSNMNL